MTKHRGSLSNKIKALKDKQKECQHTYRRVNRTWKLRGEVTEIEKLYKCSKCSKEIPRQ